MKARTCKCGGSIKLDKCLMEGFLVDCMKCDECGETLFTPEQTKQLKTDKPRNLLALKN